MKTQHLRPRVIVYAVVLILLTSAVFWGIVTRVLVSLDVIRDRNALYCETVEGLIENVYTLKVINKGGGGSVFMVVIDGLEGAQVLSDGWQAAVAEGEVHDVVVRVQVDPIYLERRSSILSFTACQHAGAFECHQTGTISWHRWYNEYGKGECSDSGAMVPGAVCLAADWCASECRGPRPS